MTMPALAIPEDVALDLEGLARMLVRRVASSTLGNADKFDPAALVSLEQAQTIEIIAMATASVSVLTSLCGIYWFLVMRRNFRRDLILLLILGNV